MMRGLLSVLILGWGTAAFAGGAGIPATVAHQGVISVHGARFTGDGAFRFALVNADTNAYLWVNDGSGVVAPNAPTNAVTLAVINGVYNVRLGDASLTNMTALPSGVFEANDDVALRVWFDDGTGNGVHQLNPDQPIASAPFAFHSATIADDAVTTSKIANGEVMNDDLADMAVTNEKIAADAVGLVEMMDNAVGNAEMRDNAVGNAEMRDAAVGSVEIIDNSITAADLASEPGIVWTSGTGTITLSVNFQSMLSKTINVPAPGYVLAIGSAYFIMFGSDGQTAEAHAGISTVATSLPTSDELITSSQDTHISTITAQKVFPVLAGNNEFHFVGRKFATATVISARHNLTLVYLPTLYGTLSATEEGGADSTEDASVNADYASDVASNWDEPVAVQAVPSYVDELRARLAAMEKRMGEFERINEGPAP